VRAAVATVLGALPAIERLEPSILELAGVDRKAISGLEDYARAAAEASSRHRTASAPGREIVELYARAVKVREILRSDLGALVTRGLVDRRRLSSFTGNVGYQNVGFELVDYANLFDDCWPQIRGRTALTAGEVVNAKELSERLVRAAGERKLAKPVLATARIRRQALTLLVKAYDEARRAVAFLRWHTGDAEAIAPSLYGRRKRKKNESAVALAPSAEPTRSMPVVDPADARVSDGLSPPAARDRSFGTAEGAPRVRERGFDEHVEITGQARPAGGRERVGADHDKPDPFGVQRLQEFAPVLVKLGHANRARNHAARAPPPPARSRIFRASTAPRRGLDRRARPHERASR